MSINKDLPHSPDAEKSVLASILLDDSKFDEVKDLSPSDFYNERYRQIFSAMLDAHAQHLKINMASLREFLRDEVPYSFLVALQEEIPNYNHITSNAQIIKVCARKRKLIRISTNTLSALYDPEADFDSIIDANINNLQKLKVDADPEKKLKPYTGNDLQRDLGKTREGLLTEYAKLDNYVSIPPAAITLVAGRPGHGKTTFMLNLLLNMIRKYPDQNFYFFSYEEAPSQIATKIIQILCGYNRWNINQPLKALQAYLRIIPATMPETAFI